MICAVRDGRNFKEESVMFIKRNSVVSGFKGSVIPMVREIFECRVGLEAIKRAGRNPRLKGIVHEIIVKNRYNASPKRLFDGTKAMLSKSATAIRDDIVIKNKLGHIVGRRQLKDTISFAGIKKTVGQVKSKHYAGTKLFGTKETVKAYAKNGGGLTQKMHSTGVSSSDTSRIASKSIGTAAGNLTWGAIGRLAASSGLFGALFSGGFELIKSGFKFFKKSIGGKELFGNVIKEAAGGGISAAGGSVAATGISVLFSTMLSAVSAPAWIPAAAGIGGAIIVGGGIRRFWDYIIRKI